MSDDPLPQFISDLKDVFVAQARMEAVAKTPVQPTQVRRRYGFILFSLPPEQKELKERVWELFLKNPHGRTLMDDLWNIFYNKTIQNFTSRINVAFGDQMPPDASECGHVVQDSRHAPTYDVTVYRQPKLEGPVARTPEQALEQGGGFIAENWWPAAPSQDHPALYACAINYHYTDVAAEMATCLYHELLHIWYYHYGHPRSYPTGHGDRVQVLSCGIEGDFLEHLRLFIQKMDQISQ